MQLQIDIIQKRAHQSAQEVAMKGYLQTCTEEYRRVFEAEVDRGLEAAVSPSDWAAKAPTALGIDRAAGSRSVSPTRVKLAVRAARAAGERGATFSFGAGGGALRVELRLLW